MLVVRRQGRRGGAVLHLDPAEFEDGSGDPLRIIRPTAQGRGHDRDVPAQRPGLHGAERRPGLQVLSCDLVHREVRDQEELDRYWTKLSADKNREQCGWLADKFGMSWQIVPAILERLISDKD